MRKLKELLAMVLVGDGVLALLAPSRHSVLWRGGSPRWNRVMYGFAEHPWLTRALAAAELASGIALASRQWQRIGSTAHT